ncbi:hypothetical protein R6Z07F_017367 [Ovis aries]
MASLGFKPGNLATFLESEALGNLEIPLSPNSHQGSEASGYLERERQTLYHLSHKGSAVEHYSALKRMEILSQAAATQVSLEDIMLSRISQSSRDKTLPDSLVAQMVKCLPTVWETGVQSLDLEDPLEKAMATHSSTLAWRILWTEEPGRLQFMGVTKSRTRLE